MDTKSKKFSYSTWMKALAGLVLVFAFTAIASQVYDMGVRSYTDDYTPTLAQTYENDSEAFWKAADMENSVLEVAGNLKSESYVKEGKTLTQQRLRSAWRDFYHNNFGEYYYRNYELQDRYYFDQDWTALMETMVDASQFDLDKDADGNIIMKRNGPTDVEPFQQFEQYYKLNLQKLPERLIAEDLNDLRQYMQTIEGEPNLRYYVRHGNDVFANVPESQAKSFADAPIYYALENLNVRMRLGNSLMTGAVGNGYSYEVIDKSISTGISLDTWYFGGLENTQAEYDVNDVAYIWLTEDYVSPLQAAVEQNRALTIRYMAVITAAAFLLLVCLIYLICVTGRSGKGEAVRINWLDHVFTEINLGLIALVCAGYTGLCYLAWRYQFTPILWGASVLCCGLVLLLLLSLVRRLKDRTFLRNCLIWKLCRLLASPFRKGWHALRALAHKPITVKKAVWFTALYGILCTVCAIIFPISIVLIILASYMVFKLAATYQKVRDGVREISNGNLAYQIDTSDQNDFSDMAADINRIADGLHAAVDNELKSERMKSELITNVSHDIRTPLTSIITYVDLIQKEGIGSENAGQYFDIISQKAQRLKALTDDLFEVSKAASGNIKVEFADVDMADLVRQGLGELNDKVEQSGLDFRVNLPTEEVLVRADGKLLWRVVENLLSNVFKYALPASRVYIDVTDRGGEVEFTMKNISAYELNVDPNELLERFKRGDDARHSEGNGLGLAIAKNLVELQHGTFTIAVDGDLFKAVIELPKAQPAQGNWQSAE